MTRNAPRTVLSAALLLGTAALLALPSPARADEIRCRPNYDFCVEVDGQYPQDARFLVSDIRGKFLIDMPSRKNDMLIDLPSRKAIAVPRDHVQPDGDGGILKLNDALPANASSYALSIDGPVLRFQTDNAKVRVLKVLDRPPVVGPIGLDALIADRMEYREGMKHYSPDVTAMKALREDKKPIEIEAYFGTWCPHCKLYMPKLLRVLKDADNPNFKVTLIGVPKGFGGQKGPWEDKGIQSIPTIIVKYEGKELTRLASHEGAVPEDELAGILSALK